MHRHLVAIEVRVERRADHRVNAQRLSFNEHRLKRLDPEPVQRGSAVQKYRMTIDDVFEYFPNLLTLPVDHFLRALHRFRHPALNELSDDERLEQFHRHVFRKAALMQLQFGSDNDHRSSRIVDTLAQEVLAEPALLSFQHVGE